MITPDHWLVRGAQSAIFYYLSCGPCLTVSYQRRRRKEAARDRKQKELELRRRPELYAHPGPAEMNQNWREDMELGASLPRKRPRRNTIESATKRGVTRDSLELAYATEDLADVSSKAYAVGSIGVRRYRRADEELEWIVAEHEETKARTGADYRMLRAPPINDLHPAVVSLLPLKPEDRRWMKDPPPSTDFLHGRKGVTPIRRSSSRKAPSDSAARDHDIRFAQHSNSPRSGPNVLAPAPVLRTSSKRSDKDRRNVPISRPDSAVSTTGGRIRTRHASRMHHESSTASSDADDDSDHHHAPIARPRPTYRADRQPSRQNSARHRTGIADRDFGTTSAKTSTTTPPQTSPTLFSHSTYSENLSPRISPKSADSLASPLSSEGEDVLSPRVRSGKIQTKDATARAALPVSVLSTRPQIQTSKPDKQAKQRSSTQVKQESRPSEPINTPTSADNLTRMVAGLGLHESTGSTDLSIMNYDNLLDMQQLSENAAKEQMWLGPRPVKPSLGTPEKRHSVDF